MAASQARLGPWATAAGAATAALRPDSTTLGLPGRAVSFDAAGRLVRAFHATRSVRRTLDDRYVEKRKAGRHPWSYARRELDRAERGALLEAVRRDVQAIRARLPGRAAELASRLDAVLAWTPARLEAEAARFAAAYRPIPILPPDQYRALVLQLTEGCAHSRCAFCELYRDRPYHVKRGEEFSAHLAAVRGFFGAGLSLRRGLFLGDANALILPLPRLLEALDRIEAELGPAWTRAGVAAFTDAFGGLPKSVEEFQALAGRGLRRVYLGLESGADALLRFLDKPATAADAVALVRRLHAAGIRVGVIVMLGLGGDRHAAAHLAETRKVLEAMQLCAGDLLYLSPLVVTPGSAYGERCRAAGIRPLDDDALEAQRQALASLFPPGIPGRPKVAVYDIRDFLY
ncbi:MAG: radical SAM protein [Candidatus Methylomirabilales bacterium]